MVTYLPTDFTKLPAYDPTEYLSDEEVEAILEREQAEAEAKYGQKDFNPSLHPRDAEGQFAEVPDERLMISAGPMAGVKMTIGTLDEEDQKTVQDTLDRLAMQYPSVVKQITSVSAAKLKTRWGSFDDTGKMKFTNLGVPVITAYGQTPKDPHIAVTVAHEYGHAMFRDMAGIEGPNERPPSINKLVFDQGVPISEARQRIQEYNAMVRDQNDQIFTVVDRLYQEVRKGLGGNSQEIFDQLRTEFVENPEYVASDPQELLAEAFGHYANGQHGKISDIVGRAIDEHYGVAA